MALAGPWAIAVATITTAAVTAAMVMLPKYLEDTAPEIAPRGCEDSYYADALDCLAKDKNGNPISISINTPETPRP